MMSMLCTEECTMLCRRNGHDKGDKMHKESKMQRAKNKSDVCFLKMVKVIPTKDKKRKFL
jgi:hypothetical protein